MKEQLAKWLYIYRSYKKSLDWDNEPQEVKDTYLLDAERLMKYLGL